MSKMQIVDDTTFSTLVDEASGVTVVDFWAAWCPPCRIIQPVLEDLAGKYEGQATVLSLDTDDNPRTASRFGIRSLPTVLFFRDGVLKDQLVGAVPGAMFEQKIARLVEAAV